MIGVGLLIFAARGGAITVRSAAATAPPHSLFLSLGVLRLHHSILGIDFDSNLVHEFDNNA
jgi:hypothetical protein